MLRILACLLLVTGLLQATSVDQKGKKTPTARPRRLARSANPRIRSDQLAEIDNKPIGEMYDDSDSDKDTSSSTSGSSSSSESTSESDKEDRKPSETKYGQAGIPKKDENAYYSSTDNLFGLLDPKPSAEPEGKFVYKK